MYQKNEIVFTQKKFLETVIIFIMADKPIYVKTFRNVVLASTLLVKFLVIYFL